MYSTPDYLELYGLWIAMPCHNEVQNTVQLNEWKYTYEKNKTVKHPNNKINMLHY